MLVYDVSSAPKFAAYLAQRYAQARTHIASLSLSVRGSHVQHIRDLFACESALLVSKSIETDTHVVVR